MTISWLPNQSMFKFLNDQQTWCDKLTWRNKKSGVKVVCTVDIFLNGEILISVIKDLVALSFETEENCLDVKALTLVARVDCDMIDFLNIWCKPFVATLDILRKLNEFLPWPTVTNDLSLLWNVYFTSPKYEMQIKSLPCQKRELFYVIGN